MRIFSFTVTFNGDPHITTIDNGRYTCHVQGLFVFAQTTETARIRAEYNFLNVSGDLDLIYPDDLFKVYVRSKYVAPALSYIERTKGYGSIFTSYSIIALNYTFEISNDNGQFSRIVLFLFVRIILLSFFVRLYYKRYLIVRWFSK